MPCEHRPTAAVAQGDLNIDFDQLAAALGTHERADVPCPACGPDRRHAVNRRRLVLRIWRREPDFIGYHCARCGARGWAKRGSIAQPRREPRRDAPAPPDDDGYTFRRAIEMWSAAQPADGSIVAMYLRSRGIVPTDRLPGTLRALTSPPAMIAAFGMAHEPEPGRLAIDEAAIRGVHVTYLRPDGSGKADGQGPSKKMFGHSSGWPIVLAPMNDLLGLAITEGIEDALSIHMATGLGAWAAGAACRLPKLAPAVPRYASAITIVADRDPVGQRFAAELARLLAADGLAAEVTEP
jgi:hypothetical protein